MLHTIRARFVATTVVLVVGVLAVSALITFGFAQRATVQSARTDLTKKAPLVRDQLVEIDRRLNDSTPQRRAQLRALVALTLRSNDAHLVVVNADGSVTPGSGIVGPTPARPVTPEAAGAVEVLNLPAELTPSALDTQRLLAGNEQVGRSGKTVFVAEPLPIGATASAKPVLVLTKQVDDRSFNGIGTTYLVVAVGAVALATIATVLLSTRLTRPIDELRRTAHALAGGDLSARVDPKNIDDEFAELARTMNNMAIELEATRGSERAFLMSVSHDLRTPLTSIRGYAEAMADGTIADDEARARAATVIRSEAERLERLVRDLLDLARLDNHEFTLDRVRLDASDVVSRAAEAFGPAAFDAGVALTVQTSPTVIDNDPVRLGQVVGNLVENALKYAQSSVQVSAGPTAGAYVISVDDDGPGISAPDLARVFDRLYTARASSGRNVGTGLGLAIVRELVDAMGGHVGAETVAGGGTRFWVSLPIAPDTASDAAPDDAQRDGSSTT